MLARHVIGARRKDPERRPAQHVRLLIDRDQVIEIAYATGELARTLIQVERVTLLAKKAMQALPVLRNGVLGGPEVWLCFEADRWPWDRDGACDRGHSSLWRYWGGMRSAPSSRMVSPFNMRFSRTWQTSAAYSSGCPRREGNGTSRSSAPFTSSGKPATMGVLNKPGASVTTRMPCRARSRAAGSVMPTTPAFDAAYAVCPT